MREFDKKFIGQTLKTMRRNAGLTQAQLAEKAGLSEKHISKIEQGTNLPTLDNFLKIADILNLNIPEFGLTPESQDIIRNELLQLISTSDSSELKFYRDLLFVAKQNLDILKNNA